MAEHCDAECHIYAPLLSVVVLSVVAQFFWHYAALTGYILPRPVSVLYYQYHNGKH